MNLLWNMILKKLNLSKYKYKIPLKSGINSIYDVGGIVSVCIRKVNGFEACNF